MGAQTPQGLTQRAMRGWAQSFGPPVAGKSKVSATLTAANQTLTLEGGKSYRLYATQACFIGSADATVAVNQEYLAPNVERFMSVPAGGLTLHVSNGALPVGGVLYVSQVDDVE